MGLAAVCMLLCCCSSVSGSVVRGHLMDHRFRREILPFFLDSYRLKMRDGMQPHGPVETAPEWMDRG